jgi:hypothetical protein
LPIALSQRPVEPGELAGQCQHCANHVFGDTRLVAIGVGEKRAFGKRRPVNPIDPGARDLDELQTGCQPRHLGREPHRHQHVDLRQPRQDVGFRCDDDLAWSLQVMAHRLF